MSTRADRASRRKWVGLCVGALLLGLSAWGIYAVVAGTGAPKKKVVQQISLVKPPMPKKEEKPPEPEKVERPQVKDEVQIPQPQDQPRQDDSPPPAANLGVDADGGSGSDGFGLVGNRGGRDITTIGGTGTGSGTGVGGGRPNYGFYTTQLQSQIQEELNKTDQLRGSEYRALVNVWVGADGKVARVELASTTGDAGTDALLRQSIAQVQRLRAPPENMPQPLRLRISARSAG